MLLFLLHNLKMMSILLHLKCKYPLKRNATCFKYDCNKTKYWFNFLQPIIPDLYIDNKRSIYLQRNNVWVNPWYFVYISILQSNHNITFVVSSNNILALV